MTGRVIVVGSINIDLVARGDRLPAAGETILGATFSRHHGGKGGNQAVAAARLGASVAFVGAIGDDDFGRDARSALAAEGVGLAALRVLDGPTGVALILVDGRGENLIAVASGANAALTPVDVRAALAGLAPAAGDVVLVGCEIPLPAAREALRVGRDAGATTVLNPAPAGGVDRSMLGLVDVLTPNRGELATLIAEDARRTGRTGLAAGVGGQPEDMARTLLDANAEGPGVRVAVVVTLGAAGAVVVRRRLPSLDVPAPRGAAERAVDAVGAGDAFSGALAAGLAGGGPLDEAVIRAVHAASLSTARAGAREGMPTIAELESALTEGEPTAGH